MIISVCKAYADQNIVLIETGTPVCWSASTWRKHWLAHERAIKSGRAKIGVFYVLAREPEYALSVCALPHSIPYGHPRHQEHAQAYWTKMRKKVHTRVKRLIE